MDNFAGMIEACEIFNKHADKHAGFHCEHDTLYVCGVEPYSVSERDVKRLEELGFFIDDEAGGFKSYKWGSC